MGKEKNRGTPDGQALGHRLILILEELNNTSEDIRYSRLLDVVRKNLDDDEKSIIELTDALYLAIFIRT